MWSSAWEFLVPDSSLMSSSMIPFERHEDRSNFGINIKFLHIYYIICILNNGKQFNKLPIQIKYNLLLVTKFLCR